MYDTTKLEAILLDELFNCKEGVSKNAIENESKSIIVYAQNINFFSRHEAQKQVLAIAIKSIIELILYLLSNEMGDILYKIQLSQHSFLLQMFTSLIDKVMSASL